VNTRIRPRDLVRPVLGQNDQAIVASAVMLASLLLFGAVFSHEALGALRVWIGSRTYNHCFLIAPLSIYLIWLRRRELGHMRPRPYVKGLWLMIAFPAAWVVAAAINVLELRQMVVLAMVQVTLLSVFGPAYYRALAAPFLYLFFLVPTGEYLVPSLQAFTAWFAVQGVSILGIPVFWHDGVIQTPVGVFAVAEACAGLRFLIASFALGVFFAVITYRSYWRRLVFVACSIVVPIVANGIRVLGMILFAEWFGNPAAALADHVLYGWIFFSIILVTLMFVGQFFAEPQERRGSRREVFPNSNQAAMPGVRMAIVLVGCVFIGSLGLLASVLPPSPSIAVGVAKSGPRVSSPWRALNSAPDWSPVAHNATKTFLDTFTDGSAQVDRFVALYDTRNVEMNFIRSQDQAADEHIWKFKSSHSSMLLVEGRQIPVIVSTWSNGSYRRIVWSFYVVNGLPVIGSWTVKWNELYAHLTGSRCLSAYVSISKAAVDNRGDIKTAASLLAATEQLSSYLCGTPMTKASK
jgi:exosortase A